MVRDDDSIFLLYIEPSKEEKLSEPIKDGLTALIQNALSKAKGGTANYSRIDEKPKHTECSTGRAWKGRHRTACGEISSNQDYFLENGLITNSLATFYIANYRNSISKNDWKKIQDLISFYQKEIDVSDYLN